MNPVSFKGESIEKGLIADFGAEFSFFLQRKKNAAGFEYYIIQNQAQKQTLTIKRFLFDHFRSFIRRANRQNKQNYEDVCIFKRKKYFKIIKHSRVFEIQQFDKDQIVGKFIIEFNAFPTFDTLLFDPAIDHPNDVLSKIIAYHRIFQFTFAESSRSLNSNLSLRTDVLSHVVDYIPKLGTRKTYQVGKPAHGNAIKSLDSASVAKENIAFKPRLSEKNPTPYELDYELVFSNIKMDTNTSEKKANQNFEALKKFVYPLPLHSDEIKNYSQKPLVCEYSQEDIVAMRSSFLNERNSEYFLGFEMIEAVFKNTSGQLKSFKFPLYYTKVDIKESGRTVLLEPLERGRFYLNHISLAQLIENFTSKDNPEAATEEFFNTLLSQVLQVDGEESRIYLSRQLPVKKEYFEKTRDILFGFPGENGNGGILSEIKMLGVACDLEQTFLYKLPKDVTPLTRCLEDDLESIYSVAREKPHRFYNSLLGKFLTPEAGSQERKVTKLSEQFFIPGFLPRSTQNLIDKLNRHDLVLLEGPPGTGKTHTIMNLLIHTVCAGKKILIVSDQSAAITALEEKLFSYMAESLANPSEITQLRRLFQAAVKIFSDIPQDQKFSSWSKTLQSSIVFDEAYSSIHAKDSEVLKRGIAEIDIEIKKFTAQIQTVMKLRTTPKGGLKRQVSAKHMHATTTEDIQSFVEFLTDLSRSKNAKALKNLVREFISCRVNLQKIADETVYQFFAPQNCASFYENLIFSEALLKSLLKKRPKSYSAFIQSMQGQKFNDLTGFINKKWLEDFPVRESEWQKKLRTWSSFVIHPETETLKILLRTCQNLIQIYIAKDGYHDGFLKQILEIHKVYAPNFTGDYPIAMDVTRLFLDASFKTDKLDSKLPTVQEVLEKIQALQIDRDRLVRELFLSQLTRVAQQTTDIGFDGSSSVVTKISALIDSLKSIEQFENFEPIRNELQRRLFDSFPFWICRKQMVPFLLPCEENSFDLLVVDEATQCKVDDAFPLLFRARKILVVGDDKQTVLAKNSVVDDYLFREFNLEDHLKSTQARGIKGGGSHIFGLIKGIRESSVMLDEHYRCPPDIIWYSNHYVYGDELKTMQWTQEIKEATVEVNYSEQNESSSGRQDHGQYKGIETDMIERFMKFVATKIQSIEKQSGKTIDVENQVAICYFLLKNEPYFKSIKKSWLEKLDRGSDILDGAGAALQGKERDYIFYLWDIFPGNLMAFKQGDDPTKRKGELNVLMSRPKKKAYHFLHKDFKKLDHQKASITDYLWRQYLKQSERQDKKTLTDRIQKPDAQFRPWRRFSGPLIAEILKVTDKKFASMLRNNNFQMSTIVGNPRQRVDLLILGDKPSDANLGFVDLSGFEYHDQVGAQVVDYYFQLARAKPQIEPRFLFIYELLEPK